MEGKGWLVSHNYEFQKGEFLCKLFLAYNILLLGILSFVYPRPLTPFLLYQILD